MKNIVQKIVGVFLISIILSSTNVALAVTQSELDAQQKEIQNQKNQQNENEQKQKGTSIIYVGEDLDVLLALSDRILVLCGGKENGILDARKTTKEEVGLLMTNLQNGGADNE